MICSRIEHDLALMAGDDLGDQKFCKELEKHLSKCSHCRARYQAMKSSLAVFPLAESSVTYDSFESMWPSVKHRIASGEAPPSLQRWQGPVAGGLLLLLSVALVLMIPLALKSALNSPALQRDAEPTPAPRTIPAQPEPNHYPPEVLGLRAGTGIDLSQGRVEMDLLEEGRVVRLRQPLVFVR